MQFVTIDNLSIIDIIDNEMKDDIDDLLILNIYNVLGFYDKWKNGQMTDIRHSRVTVATENLSSNK